MKRYIEDVLGVVTLGGWLIALPYLVPLMYAAVTR